MRMNTRLFGYEATPEAQSGWWKPYAVGAGLTLVLFVAVAVAYSFATHSGWYARPGASATALPQGQPAAVALAPEEVAKLEAEVAQNPENLASRARLIEYYSSGYHPTEIRPHMLWMIRNHPEGIVVGQRRFTPMVDATFDPEGYDEGRKLWLPMLTRHHLSVVELKNAAEYFKFADHTIAQKLLMRAEVNDDSVGSALGEEYYTHLADGPAWHWAKPYGDTAPGQPSIRVVIQGKS
jgi:hypothetical protein